MSVCTFMAADVPLEQAALTRDGYTADIDDSAEYEGFLLAFPEADCYTDKPYAVFAEWHDTKIAAEQTLAYLKDVLRRADTVELWRVWLGEYWEFEDRPVIHRRTLAIEELTAAQLCTFDGLEIWNTPDKRYPSRPSFYCWEIRR